ncbi:ATP-grasp peptide maturase system methyltransferase [Sphaerisporangium sp. NPDC051017]|uniref:ATP-grasp peptide maturase system methyltransferase n=1 Tax=Sphaerisporangium sp. NPDC051017 TaxID=3154636 RepID=UPI00342A1AD6
MNTHVNERLTARLRSRLADELSENGDLRSPEWRRAVGTVPREVFLGERVYRRVDSPHGTDWEPISTAADEKWLGLAYQNVTWVTQFDERDDAVRGAPTSSSTLPGLVVRMLEDLQVENDHRVLEIGTGTGYSTALLCERLGSGQVTSVEVDPEVAARARRALQRAGHAPALLIGDGLAGHQGGAPYDRIIATCSVRTVPGSWLHQARRDGLILATLSGWLYGSALARLTVTARSEAEGEFLPGTISFMPARSHAAPLIGDLPSQSDGKQRATVFGADVLAEWTPLWIAQLAAPGAQSIGVSTEGRPVAYCVIDQAAASWAWLVLQSDEWTVRQGGPLRLWDRIEAALTAWHDAGKPSQQAFRLRIKGDEQSVFLPGTPGLRWTLPVIPESGPRPYLPQLPLDGSDRSRLAMLTGLSPERIDELGGVREED